MWVEATQHMFVSFGVCVALSRYILISKQCFRRAAERRFEFRTMVPPRGGEMFWLWEMLAPCGGKTLWIPDNVSAARRNDWFKSKQCQSRAAQRHFFTFSSSSRIFWFRLVRAMNKLYKGHRSKGRHTGGCLKTSGSVVQFLYPPWVLHLNFHLHCVIED